MRDWGVRPHTATGAQNFPVKAYPAGAVTLLPNRVALVTSRMAVPRLGSGLLLQMPPPWALPVVELALLLAMVLAVTVRPSKFTMPPPSAKPLLAMAAAPGYGPMRTTAQVPLSGAGPDTAQVPLPPGDGAASIRRTRSPLNLAEVHVVDDDRAIGDHRAGRQL